MSSSSVEVLQALQLACSQDPGQLKVGEEKLLSWKREKGFYTELAGVFSNRSVETQVRWMALTCTKNGVDQFWRPGAVSAISEEEKAVIRSALLQCIEEPVPQVSTQLAVLIARIARLDCPEKWPELLPVLTEGVRSSSEATRRCYLSTLKHVIKTLAGRRLIPQRKVFYDVTTSLFVYMVGLWNTHLQEGVALLRKGQQENALHNMDMARICLKILRQMLVHGFPKFSVILEALQFVNTLLERIPSLLDLRYQLPVGHSARPHLETAINLMLKIVTEVQNHQPLSFAGFVTPSLELVFKLVFSAESRGQLYESLVISCLNLFRLILVCEDYNPPKPGLMTESIPPPGIMEAHQARLEFFKASRCQHLLEELIGHYLLLSDEELQTWQDSPEDFGKEEAGDACSLRRCVEDVLMGLVHSFQLTVVPSLLAMATRVQTVDANADAASLRVKDAVYKAVGLCAFDLYDELDYDKWYQTQLLSELSIYDTRYKLVRHRVVWLLGQWVTVKMSSSLRPSLYSVLTPLLGAGEHMAIRLTAAEVIRICVDDLDFSTEEFAPFLSECMGFLFQLLREAAQADTKMKVLNILSLLMERVGPGIQPHVPALIQALPALWEESGRENCQMLRTIIINTLTNITRGLGVASSSLHDFIIPVIKLATDVKMTEHVYLAEDGLLLWLSVLKNSCSPSPGLVQLLGNMVGILGLQSPSDDSSTSMAGLMDITSDSFKTCFRILDAYVVLCTLEPQYYAESCNEVVLRACQYYLCDVKPDGVVLIVQLVASVVRLHPACSTTILDALLPTVLRKLLEEEDYPPTTSAYLTLVARVLVHQPTYFFVFLEKMCSQSQQTAAELFGLIVDTWSVRLDSVVSVRCRKLTGLAIANLLPEVDVCVTSRFEALVNMCVDVMHDVMETDDNQQLFDLLVSGSAEESRDEGVMATIDTEHDKREKKLCGFDPVRTISLHQHLAAKLEQCWSVHGAAVYSDLMGKVNLAVREQLLEFIPLKAAPQLLNIFLGEGMSLSANQ